MRTGKLYAAALVSLLLCMDHLLTQWRGHHGCVVSTVVAFDKCVTTDRGGDHVRPLGTYLRLSMNAGNSAQTHLHTHLHAKCS